MATVDRPRTESIPEPSLFDEKGLPWLENGDRMDQKTFHERYEQTPPGFKAELIDGIVYVMSSLVGLFHGERDFDTIGWLAVYRAATPGTSGQSNTTAIIGNRSEPQPDSALLILPEYGGQTQSGGRGDRYTLGAPELVVEVSQSSRSIDLSAKRDDYRRAGVREYLVLDLERKAVVWSRFFDGDFVAIEPDEAGVLRSVAFPGLWLDPVAMVSGDIAQVLAVLNLGLASPEHAAFVAELRHRSEQIKASQA